MEKRDLVLDFTSLLDVIMIMLFIVMSSMGQASFEAKEKAEAQMEENTGIQQELNDIQRELVDLQQEYEKEVANNEKLQEQQAELLKENNLYKAKNRGMDVDEALLYESLMKKAKKITLICTPYINPNKTDSNAVEISIYSNEDEAEQEVLDVVIFTHNFNLTKEERFLKNAEMQAEMYRSLERAIEGDDLELILITIQYTYGDKNFSQADLNNIIEAIEDIERNYSLTCYIDKVKQ